MIREEAAVVQLPDTRLDTECGVVDVPRERGSSVAQVGRVDSDLVWMVRELMEEAMREESIIVGS